MKRRYVNVLIIILKTKPNSDNVLFESADNYIEDDNDDYQV